MSRISHPVFGSADRAERPETPKQAQLQPQEPLEEPTMPDNDLKALIECGRITDTIEIDGKKFQMSTLSDDAQEAIFKKFSSAMSDAGSFVELRRTVVAMAVELFNGRPFESVYPADAEPQPDAFAAKLALVRMMQGQVVDKLYTFYEELIKRSKQKVDPEQVKN